MEKHKKRVLSLVFVRNSEEMKKVTSQAWNKCFAKSWIKNF